MDCPFCADEIKNSVFAESKNFLAIYNIAPILPGHSLILPKRHLTSVMELSDTIFSEMMLFSKNITGILLEVMHSDSFNWSVQDNYAAGQTVSHLHLHIVPRQKGDLNDPGDWYAKINDNFKEILDSKHRSKLSHKQMNEIVLRLRNTAEKRNNK
jgi:bis(5'-adenosyl)-triphosphatase